MLKARSVETRTVSMKKGEDETRSPERNWWEGELLVIRTSGFYSA